MSHDIEADVRLAVEGDRAALDRVVRAVQDDVYGLALRMLWHPEDAEDATQEILIRILTHLGSFRGEARFRTWVYRVASNFLLTTRKRRAEREELTFEEFGRQLREGSTDGPTWAEATPQERLLIEEVKIGCSRGMLLCLDREHRLAYVLGEILDLPGPEAAEVLGISPAAFRKRLSRARKRLHAFLRETCGLVEPGNPCRCHARVQSAIERGRVDPDRLLFARPGRPADAVLSGKRAVEALRDEAEVLRTNPDPDSPRDFTDALRELLDSERFDVLRD